MRFCYDSRILEEENMKKDTIYSSSNEAFLKLIVLLVTLGISLLASFIDTKSCYITVCVQVVNNLYDFYQFADNKVYVKEITRLVKVMLILSVIALIVSIIGMINIYPSFTTNILGKLFSILLVTAPLYVVYGDHKLNIKKEDESEG